MATLHIEFQMTNPLLHATGWRWLAIFWLSAAGAAQSASYQAVQNRIDFELSENKPIVVHVIVLLCDNKNQGIVPVSAELGDGQNPRTNLYWGAAFGFKTFLVHRASFDVLSTDDRGRFGVLQNLLLYKKIKRNGAYRDVMVVGEAWDGSRSKSAIARFLSIAAGQSEQTETVVIDGKENSFRCGGASALVAFVGHNALMDFSVGAIPHQEPGAFPRSSVVLACASKFFFFDVLKPGGSHSLLLTNGLMAPEAYTLEAIIEAFVGGQSTGEVRNAAAAAYHTYQRCGFSAAKRLFSAPD